MTVSLILGVILIVAPFLLGSPIFIAFLMGSTVLFLHYAQLPGINIAQHAVSSINSFTLVAIPFFILLGNIMANTGATTALFAFVRSIIGHIRAGVGVAAIIVSALFGTMCGSGVATAVAVGSIAVPELTKSGYSRERSAAIIGSSGPLGFLIPPSLAAILLAEIMEVSVGDLFAAIVIPGIVSAILLSIACYVTSRNVPEIKQEPHHTWRERGVTFSKCIPALIVPVVLFTVIYGGIATPTESAAVGCVVALIVGAAFYRQLNWQSLRTSLKSTVSSSCSIFCIILGATIFARVLGFMQIPQSISFFVAELGLGPTHFLIVAAFLFFVLGMFLDAFALLYIALPPIAMTVSALGINPIYFSIVFIMVIYIGQLTPPVCITLYAAASGAGATSSGTIRHAVPYLIAIIIATFLCILIPQMSLFLPGLIQ
ncbi:MAG: TRAP transporter large permease [Chloroflexota bacterium]|nr:TRAP transporter large permease [Chloroflexota bacterium]